MFIYVCIELCTNVAHNTAQNRPDNFPYYPPDNYHCSDDVYLREESPLTSTEKLTNSQPNLLHRSMSKQELSKCWNCQQWWSCDDAAAAACYLLTVAATDCARAVRWCGTSCLLSDGVTIDDISVCVL